MFLSIDVASLALVKCYRPPLVNDGNLRVGSQIMQLDLYIHILLSGYKIIFSFQCAYLNVF